MKWVRGCYHSPETFRLKMHKMSFNVRSTWVLSQTSEIILWQGVVTRQEKGMERGEKTKERKLSSGNVHSAQTDWAPSVLVSLRPIKWRRRAWPVNAPCRPNWVDLLQVSSVQFISCAAIIFVTTCIVCGAVSMKRSVSVRLSICLSTDLSVRQSVCPNIGSRRQTHYCMFAAVYPARMRYRSIVAAAAGECGQWHVVSVHT